METVMEGRLIIAGEVVIEGVRHIVETKYVKCDPSLNHRSWNTTVETSRCPKCFQSIQSQKDMDFFKQLTEISPNLDLTLRLMKKGDKVTISVLPATAEEIAPLTIAGTVDELDAGFLDAIRKPLQVAAGLTTNAEAFEAAVTKGTEKPQEKGKAKSTPATTPAKEKAAEQPKATVKDLVEPTPVETHELPLVEKPAGDELIKQVQACKSHDELTTLVGARGNQERFDTESDLQAAYNAKRSELNAAADAPAAPAKPAPPKPGPPRPGA